jgi:hypothetical protein
MIYEWLLSEEYEVCDHMLYLFLYLDCKELCGNVGVVSFRYPRQGGYERFPEGNGIRSAR